MFQFHKVQLKAQHMKGLAADISLFQFHKVQLKETEAG